MFPSSNDFEMKKVERSRWIGISGVRELFLWNVRSSRWMVCLERKLSALSEKLDEEKMEKVGHRGRG